MPELNHFKEADGELIVVYERLGLATPFRYRIFSATLEYLEPERKAIANGVEYNYDGRAMGVKQRFSKGNFFFYWQEYNDDYFDEEGVEDARTEPAQR